MSEFFTKNNVDIPSIGLGTWDLRGKEGENVIQVALDVGYRHIDTAQMYENEKEVGNAIINSKIEGSPLESFDIIFFSLVDDIVKQADDCFVGLIKS